MILASARLILENQVSTKNDMKDLEDHQDNLPEVEYTKQMKKILQDEEYWKEAWTMIRALAIYHTSSVSRRTLEQFFFEIFDSYRIPDSKELFRTRMDPRYVANVGSNNDLVNIYNDVMWALAALSDNPVNLAQFISSIRQVQFHMRLKKFKSNYSLIAVKTSWQGQFH